MLFLLPIPLVILEEKANDENSTDGDLNQLLQVIHNSIDLSQRTMSEEVQRDVILLPTVHDIFNSYLSTMAQSFNVRTNRAVSSTYVLISHIMSLSAEFSLSFKR